MDGGVTVAVSVAGKLEGILHHSLPRAPHRGEQQRYSCFIGQRQVTGRLSFLHSGKEPQATYAALRHGSHSLSGPSLEPGQVLAWPLLALVYELDNFAREFMKSVNNEFMVRFARLWLGMVSGPSSRSWS